MKKLLFVLALLGAQALGQTTGACYNGIAINKYGQPTGAAKVTVIPYGGTSPAQIYTDSTLQSQKPNPFGVSLDGNYTWCASLARRSLH